MPDNSKFGGSSPSPSTNSSDSIICAWVAEVVEAKRRVQRSFIVIVVVSTSQTYCKGLTYQPESLSLY